jgi:oxygen-independent coproporphyrinogen-3 oxidase
VVDEISQNAQVADDLEVTLECNPCAVDAPLLQDFQRAGVTRLSVGVQSLSSERLRMLGRAHDGQQACSTLEQARAAGFKRISADLMYGLPGETVEQAVQDAEAIARSGPEHISAYMLTLAPGTPMHAAVQRGEVREPDESVCAASFVAVSDALTALGYEHYEVSNFARRGCRSQHNEWVWRGGDYVGLGAGASGCANLFDGRRVRVRNRPEAASYLEAMQEAAPEALWRRSAVVESAEPLDPETQLSERIMLGLRLAEGVDIEAAGRQLGVCGWTLRRERQAAWLQERGRIEREGSTVRMARQAWVWENDTACRLI